MSSKPLHELVEEAMQHDIGIASSAMDQNSVFHHEIFFTDQEHVESLVEIENACFTPDFASSKEDIDGLLSDPTTIGLVLYQDNKPAGYVIGNRDRDEIARGDDKTFYMNTAALKPEARNRGNLQVLMRLFEEAVAKAGYRRILAHTQDDGLLLAVGRRMGYRKMGFEKDYYSPGQSAWLIRKDIAESQSIIVESLISEDVDEKKDLDLDAFPEELRPKLSRMYGRIQRLEKLMDSERAREEKDEGEAHRRMSSPSIAMATSLQRAVELSGYLQGDARVLESALRMADCLLDFSDGTAYVNRSKPEPLFQRRGRKENPLKDMYREIGHTLERYLKGLPATVGYVRQNDMSAEFASMVQGTMSMLLLRSAEFYQGPYQAEWAVESFVSTHEGSRMGAAGLKLLEAKGFGKYKDQFLQIINQCGALEPGHLSGALWESSDYFEKARSRGYGPEIDATMSIASKVRHNGSLIFTLVQGLGYSLPRLDQLGGRDMYIPILAKLERVVGANANFAWGIVGHMEDPYEEYHKMGLEGKMLDVLEFAVSHHEEDPPLSPRELCHDRELPGLKLFFKFPQLFNVVGEEGAYDVFRRITEKLPGNFRQYYALEHADKILSLGFDLDHWLDHLGQKFGENRFDETFDDRSFNYYEYTRHSVDAIKAGMSLEQYDHVYPLIRKHQLNFARLAPMFRTDMPERTVARRIRDFNRLSAIKELPIPTRDTSWLRETADHLGIDYSTFRELMGDIRAFSYKSSREALIARRPELTNFPVQDYLNDLDLFRQAGIDYRKAQTLYAALGKGIRKVISSPDWQIRLPLYIALKDIVNSDEPLEQKVAFLTRAEKSRPFLVVDPPTSCDYDEWSSRAHHNVLGFFHSSPEQNILKYPLDFALSILNNTQDDGARGVLEQILGLESRGESNKALFPVGKEYDRREVGSMRSFVPYMDAVKMFVYGMISRDPERQGMARPYFPQLPVIRRFVEQSHIRPTELYALISNDLAILHMDTAGQEDRMLAADRIMAVVSANYLRNSGRSEGKREMRSTIGSLFAMRQTGYEPFNALVTKMQDNSLYALGDSRRMHCCALMSPDLESKDLKSLYYLADPYIAWLHQAPAFNENLRQPIAGNLLVNCVDHRDRLVLASDSYEGGPALDGIADDIWFDSALVGLAGAMADTGSESIFINVQGGNGKSREFVHKFGHRMGLHSPSRSSLHKLEGDGRIQIPSKKRYLETWAGAMLGETNGDALGYLVPKHIFFDRIGYEPSRS